MHCIKHQVRWVFIMFTWDPRASSANKHVNNLDLLNKLKLNELFSISVCFFSYFIKLNVKLCMLLLSGLVFLLSDAIDQKIDWIIKKFRMTFDLLCKPQNKNLKRFRIFRECVCVCGTVRRNLQIIPIRWNRRIIIFNKFLTYEMKLCDELCMKSMPFWGNLKKHVNVVVAIAVIIRGKIWKWKLLLAYRKLWESHSKLNVCVCSLFSFNYFELSWPLLLLESIFFLFLFTFPLARKLYSSANYSPRKLLPELPELCVYSVAPYTIPSVSFHLAWSIWSENKWIYVVDEKNANVWEYDKRE